MIATSMNGAGGRRGRERGLEFLTASDGAAIAYHDEGEGRPLVFLHGLMANAEFFGPQRSLAAEGFRVVRVDLRGHGRTAAGEPPPTLDRLAADVGELAARLDFQGAVAVGWSLGASVVWRLLAGQEADRFAGAVVIDMTPCVVNEGDWTLGLSRDHVAARRQAIAEDFATFAAAAGAAIFAQPLDERTEPMARWASDAFVRADAGAVSALWTSLVEEDFREALGRIRQPTLVVHGAHSHLYGADTAEHIVAALPNGRGLRFERSGHSPHLEQPDRFNNALRDFAASLPPVPTTELTA
jgi:pimeloyl-ACP methyl ester carboxylesterase